MSDNANQATRAQTAKVIVSPDGKAFVRHMSFDNELVYGRALDALKALSMLMLDSRQDLTDITGVGQLTALVVEEFERMVITMPVPADAAERAAVLDDAVDA